MKKTTILIIALILFLALISTITFINAKQIISNFSNSSEKEYDFMWTKAICNDEFCQDYKIYCKDKQLVKQVPITGATMEIDKDWQDPRPTEIKNKLC